MARDGTATERTGDLAWAWNAARSDLLGFVQRRVESREAAEDIVQDVLERFHRRDPSTPVDDVNAWLYRSARNAIVDHYRARRPWEPLPSDLEAADDADQGLNPATRELARCLRPLVEHLPDIYRDAVTRVDLDGQTHQAAADALAVSVSGMKSRVQRGRAKLGDLLGQCCTVSTSALGEITDYVPANNDRCEC